MNSSSCESGETSAPESIYEFTAASKETSSPQSQKSTSNTMSLMKEHLNVMKELTTLYIINNYLAFQSRFHYLVAHHKKLTNDSENFYHNLFLIDLKKHQKSFVNTHLNDFYTTSQNLIKNINIDDLMKQLMNCISKFNECLKSS
ncbi:hypothetical protein PAAG_12699 [Paracoccidioides lutzii Pb01]|uniref:Uncharacterized protein n=1 Tax=Paracoccidioides lutzii (strain ATCC MYA-826 / Pb01) TaxID=502779 RepID=A0A0A2VIB3_PARBA|nr:hypothetical protein PAAG_12699 [Paracoccidioides lutzii Pb01]KGQ00644.1 hypothetical protein PAAG_12699 [Paracoccidioides lutzii Pb01]